MAAELPCYISKFQLRNFKPIGPAGIQLQLSPITIIFGTQSSGKSALLEALWRFGELIVHSRYISELPQILESYPESWMIYHKFDSSKPIEAGIGIQISSSELSEISQILNRARIQISPGELIEWKFGYADKTDQAYQSVSIAGRDILELSQIRLGSRVMRKITFPEGYEMLEPVGLTRLDPSISISAPSEAQVKLQELKPLLELCSKLIALIQQRLVASKHRSRISGIAYLSALRGAVGFKGDVSKDPDWVGIRGEYLLECLSILAGSSKFQPNWDKVKYWAAEFELWDLHSGFGGAGKLISDYLDSKLNLKLDLALGSHGSRQALCLICQLFWPYQKLILIEEPELSLHPRSIAKLPLLFYDAMKFGKQIIVTTHSSLIPLALGPMISAALQEGCCRDPNQLVSIYEFQKSEQGTIANKLELDGDGYLKEYVGSFFEVESELLSKWEAARIRRRC